MEKKRIGQVAGLVAGLTQEDATACDQILNRLKIATDTNSDNALAKGLGLKYSSVSMARARGIVPTAWVVNAANQFNVSSDWLIFGGEETAPGSACKPVKNDEFVYIPHVEATLTAGNGSPQVSDEVLEELAFKRDWVKTKGNPKNMVLMSVRGDSMEPIISDEDLVMIDQSKKDIRSGKIFAIGFEEYIFIKRVILEPGKLILRSENKEYSDISINLRDEDMADQARIIGRVIWWCHDER